MYPFLYQGFGRTPETLIIELSLLLGSLSGLPLSLTVCKMKCWNWAAPGSSLFSCYLGLCTSGPQFPHQTGCH